MGSWERWREASSGLMSLEGPTAKRSAAAVALNCILKRHGLGRGLSPAWKAALGDVRVSLDPRFSPSFAKLCAQPFDRPRSKIWDASETFHLWISRRSPIVFSPANFTAFDSSGQAHHLD